MSKILVIEDEDNVRFMIERMLAKSGHEASQADSVPGALLLLEQMTPDAVITDVGLRDSDGIDLVRRLRDDGYEGPIIVITASGSVDTAIAALRAGADDYFIKPLRLEELTIQLERHLETGRLRNRARLYKRLEDARARDEEPLGESDAWRETIDLATRVAGVPAGGSALQATLLLGETGAGKGVIARWIHQHSDTSAGPFIHVNCSALPPTLVESELFGHERGAFTDAKEARPGYFEMASGGTIFLDEIGDMPLELQAKLLTAVEERVIRRVGGTRDHKVDARVLAATNQDLESLVEDGNFRRDLLYRLNAVTIDIPPLRNRGDDALLISDRMLARLGREHGRPELRLTEDAREAIRAHSWPGNVRELINMLQRVALLSADDEISGIDLFRKSQPTPRREPESNGKLRFDFEHGPHLAAEVERELIVQALENTGGNVSKAAKLIGMQRTSLTYRIEKYGLDAFVKEIAGR